MILQTSYKDKIWLIVLFSDVFVFRKTYDYFIFSNQPKTGEARNVFLMLISGANSPLQGGRKVI